MAGKELLTAYMTLMPSLSKTFTSDVEGQANKELGGVSLAGAGGNMGRSLASGLVKGFAAVGVGHAVKEIFTSSIDAGREFDASMSQVAATMGKTTDEIGELRDFAQQMGETTKFSASESADALNYMALAGYDAETSMKMLPNVLNLAAAGNMDLAQASDMVTDTQSALGLSIDETTALVDKMAAASSKTNTSVAQLGEGFLTVGATAKTMKGGTTEAAQVLGLLADNGVKASEGGTALRNILLAISNEKFEKTFGALGVSTYDAEGNMRSLKDIFADMNSVMEGMTVEEKTKLISDAFNKFDLNKVNALLDTNAERWDEVAAAIDGSAGAAERMAGTQLDNLEGDITIFNSALEGTKIALSDAVTPALRELVQSGTEGLGELTEYFKSDEFKEFATNTAHGIVDGIKTAAGAIKFLGDNASVVVPVVVALGSGFMLFSTVASVASGLQVISAVLPAIGIGGTAAGAGLTTTAAGETAAGTAAGVAGKNLIQVGAAVLMIGGGVALAATGIALLAQSAIALSEAGGGAVAIVAGLAVGIVALGAAAALGGSMMTAGAPGILAFGAAVLMVGAGIAIATAGIALLAEQLPTISEYGLSSATALLALGGGVGALGIAAAVSAIGLAGFAIALGAADLAMAGAAITLGAFDLAVAGLGLALQPVAAAVDAVGEGAYKMGEGLDMAGAALPSIAENAVSAGIGIGVISEAIFFAADNLRTGGEAMKAAGDGAQALSMSLLLATPAVIGLGTSFADMCAQATQAMGAVALVAWNRADEIRAAFADMNFTVAVNFDVGPMPHFGYVGQFNMQTGEVPALTVDWYSQGAIFAPNRPGLIGIGDAKVPEVAAPLDKLKDMLGGAGGDVNVYVTVEGRDTNNPYELGRRIGQATAYELRMQGVSA